jgi:MerR family transcriptional regulator, copper efflux regulator
VTRAPAEQPPIACALEARDLPGRLTDWQAVLDHTTARTPVHGGVRIELGPDLDVGELARLAQAEQRCCAFFGFAITMDQRGTALEVTAPDDAAGIVAEVFGPITGS